MVIVKKQNLWKTIDILKSSVCDEKFLVLKTSNRQYEDFFFVIYESSTLQDRGGSIKSTVIHKKGRSYYTINALNELIKDLNGISDHKYMVDWEQYQNMILFMDKNKQLVKIPTNLHRIIHNN